MPENAAKRADLVPAAIRYDRKSPPEKQLPTTGRRLLLPRNQHAGSPSVKHLLPRVENRAVLADGLGPSSCGSRLAGAITSQAQRIFFSRRRAAHPRRHHRLPPPHHHRGPQNSAQISWGYSSTGRYKTVVVTALFNAGRSPDGSVARRGTSSMPWDVSRKPTAGVDRGRTPARWLLATKRQRRCAIPPPDGSTLAGGQRGKSVTTVYAVRCTTCTGRAAASLQVFSPLT